MTRILNVHLLPDLANPHELAGHTTVVVDVLRASTTITTALAAGAATIVPCLEVAEARQLASQRPGSLLGGEQGGQRIQGFDLSNSPADYSAERVGGKTIVFTTTNGTKAMTRCMGAHRVFIGSLVNRAAICEAVNGDGRVDVLCAGTNGEISLDDSLAAGAIVQRLLAGSADWRPNDAATLCLDAWRSEVCDEGDSRQIIAALAKSHGGKKLIRLGMDEDLAWAAELDRHFIVPELDQANWRIT